MSNTPLVQTKPVNILTLILLKVELLKGTRLHCCTKFEDMLRAHAAEKKRCTTTFFRRSPHLLTENVLRQRCSCICDLLLYEQIFIQMPAVTTVPLGKHVWKTVCWPQVWPNSLTISAKPIRSIEHSRCLFSSCSLTCCTNIVKLPLFFQYSQKWF